MQFLTEVKQKAADLVSENATTLLTAGGVVGTIATAGLTGRAAVRSYIKLQAEQIIQQSENSDILDPEAELPKLDTMTQAKIIVPEFIPPVITGTATITAIIFAHRMSSAKIAALAAAYGLAERNFGEYKDKVTEKLTGPKKQQIDDELAKEAIEKTPGSEKIVFVEGEVLCLEKPGGRYFNSTMESIKSAVNATNAEVFNHGFALASFFYDELGLRPTTWSEQVGFNAENLCGLTYTTDLAPGNRPCIVIDFDRLPKTDYDPKMY